MRREKRNCKSITISNNHEKSQGEKAARALELSD